MLDGALLPSRACIASVGTANGEASYSQRELIDLLNIRDDRFRSLFLRGSIDRRYLTLPPVGADGGRLPESQAELLKKHRRCAVSMGLGAIHECLNGMSAQVRDVSYLCCVTSTGFMTPGISAYLIKELGLTAECTRLDVVGMGCNAGLNGLNTAATWSLANPGKLALLLCVEVCSAAYVFDNTIRSSVVNSLFGDGAAAAAIITEPSCGRINNWPSIERFQSRLVTSAIEGMRFDWDETHERFSFYLDPMVPYVVGANVAGKAGGMKAPQSSVRRARRANARAR